MQLIGIILSNAEQVYYQLKRSWTDMNNVELIKIEWTYLLKHLALDFFILVSNPT